MFDERELTFALGEGAEHGVCPGVEEALEKFKTGERSRLTLAAPYAFGASGHAEFGVPADATVQYEVKLTSFEKVRGRFKSEEVTLAVWMGFQQRVGGVTVPFIDEPRR